MSLLEGRSLTAGYGAEPLVRGLSFALEPGGVVVLVGPNAAGKSTVFRALFGYGRAVLGGELLWRGQRVGSLADTRVPLREVAWMRQERPVYEGFLVEELADVGQAGSRAQRSAARERVLEDLPEVRPLLRRRVDQLSGGERAMASLFATLATDAPLLLLDEPAANLDTARTARMCAAVRAYVARHQAGALVIEHRAEAVQALGGGVVALV